MVAEPKHLSRSAFRFCTLLCALEGICALVWTFWRPSDADSAVLAGYSAARLAIGALIVLLISILAILFYKDPENRLSVWLKSGDRLFFIFLSALFLCFAALWGFQFSWLFIPGSLRPLLLWLALIGLQTALLVRLSFRSAFAENAWHTKYRLLPRLCDLDDVQRRVLLILLGISLLYVLLLLPSNLNGSRDWDDFRHYGGDEYVIYPILQNVMTPGQTFSATLYHHYIYEDYHYGYPFYAWSSFVLLPLRLFCGEDFLQRIDLTLPVLRILVSVIPMLLGCLLLVFIFTRFRSCWLSPAVYLFLICAPGSLQNNQGFWHPDGLNLFFICCALYFLQRDLWRYGRNFWAAAFFIGLSAATRLYGFFFFLAIGVYLLMGLLRKRLTPGRAIIKGLFFVWIMLTTILWADPFLFRGDARSNMTAILTEKTGEMSSGYGADFEDLSNDYRPGWQAWYPAFEDHYTQMFCFFYLIFSLVTACFVGENQLAHRMTLFWFVVIGCYLIFFVAVKSTQYVLPMLLPLMSCIFSLPLALSKVRAGWIRKGAWCLSGGIFAAQLLINLIKIAPRFLH